MANPERIGRYVIERLLGQGAMGQVYLGRDPSLDRKVAIKTVKDLDLEPEKKQRFLDRFKNEARAAARLSHASIVQVYDVGEDEGLGPFLVLEYIRGSSLKQILREAGPLLPARLCEVARDLGAGIDVAHAAGIIHRDIKPDNVLTGEDGRAKLADFGVARVPDAALTKEGQFLGTPCYAAPETLSAGRYSPQSDLFSFAVVLYELASGERAFPGGDASRHTPPQRPIPQCVPGGVRRSLGAFIHQGPVILPQLTHQRAVAGNVLAVDAVAQQAAAPQPIKRDGEHTLRRRHLHPVRVFHAGAVKRVVPGQAA